MVETRHGADPAYALVRRVMLPIEEAASRIRAALKDEGFGVLTEIDLAGVLRERLGVELGEYRILGACNPPIARQAVEWERDIGLLLPCNVVLRSGDAPGETVVEALDPVAQLSLSGNARIRPLADDVRARLERALDSVG